MGHDLGVVLLIGRVDDGPSCVDVDDSVVIRKNT